METDKRKVVSVMSFNSVMEAQLYKALLESSGVQARMQNDIAAQIVPAYGSLMQVNLLVAEEDQKKARQILGAKFDIDEFHHQSENTDPNLAKKKTTVKSPTVKPAAKKQAETKIKVSAKQSDAKAKN